MRKQYPQHHHEAHCSPLKRARRLHVARCRSCVLTNIRRAARRARCHRMMRIQNALLASLPRATYLQLLPGLSPVTLVFGDVLYEPDGLMQDVYFPTSSLVSLLTIVEGRQALEVGMVGREGMVGVQLALGAEVSSVRALVQGAGPALRMNGARFVSTLRRSPPLQRALNGYVNLLMEQVALTAACNRFHTVRARLARWLLMTRDRVGSADFAMTQDFLSSMLGVRRVGITEAASAFQRQNLIRYTRGQISILNHRGLEAAACSCYRRSPEGSDIFVPWQPPEMRAIAEAHAPQTKRDTVRHISGASSR